MPGGRAPSRSSPSSSTATPTPLTELHSASSCLRAICNTLPCSSAWSRGPRDFTIFDARPAPSRTCGVPPAPGHHRTGRGAPVMREDFHPVGRAGQLSRQVPILRRFPRPPPVLPLACLLPGSVEIDRGFSPPSAACAGRGAIVYAWPLRGRNFTRRRPFSTIFGAFES